MSAPSAHLIMPLLQLHQISLSFGLPRLLDEVSLQIDPGERVCLVGRNGEGKTTLLRIIAREITPDAGEVLFQDGNHATYLWQQLPTVVTGDVYEGISRGLGETGSLLSIHRQIQSDKTNPEKEQSVAERLNALEGWHQEHRIRRWIELLGMDAKTAVNTLSGGQLRRLLIARALISEPDLLILDEPTNHLDIQAIEWLERIAFDFQGALLFTTHDRAFLEKMATRIIELDRGQLTSWPGDYQNYLRRCEERFDVEERDIARFKRKLEEEERWIRQGIKARRRRNEGRVRTLLAMRQEYRERRTHRRQATFQIQTTKTSSRRVIEAENINFSYHTIPVVKEFSTIVQRADKVGVLGPNGAGKTTLVQLLLGQIQPDSGEIHYGSALQVAYFDQHRRALNENQTVKDAVAEGKDTVDFFGKNRHIVSYLRDFLFTPERMRSPVSALSGGERNRLLLARLFSKPSNLLILDEPTNDLDIETLELLEELLFQYNETLILVSHDRAFIDNVVTRTLVFEEFAKVVEYPGGYSDWERLRRQKPVASNPTVKRSPPPPKRQRTKLSYKDRRELQELPEVIERLEKTIEELQAELADPTFYQQASGEIIAQKSAALNTHQATLETSYTRWEKLDAQAGED